MNTQDNTTQEELWTKATQETKYFKFTKDKRQVVGFHKWKLEEKQVPDYHDKSVMVDGIEFSATVYVKDENETKEYEYTTLSKRLMGALYPHLAKRNADSDIVFLSVKQIGEGNGVQYDVEAVENTTN
jgi:hypothetical protein